MQKVNFLKTNERDNPNNVRGVGQNGQMISGRDGYWTPESTDDLLNIQFKKFRFNSMSTKVAIFENLNFVMLNNA